MMLKLFVCFALIATVSCKSVENNNNNNKFMVVLKDDSTMSDIQSVMNEIEVTENKLAVDMEMKFVSFLFPVVFAKLSEESVKRVSTYLLILLLFTSLFTDISSTRSSLHREGPTCAHVPHIGTNL